MDLLQQAALAWKTITEYKYIFTYGYKQKLYVINLIFAPNDFPHLAGFQYMKDLALPKYTPAKIVDRILENKISFEMIQKAAQYEEMVKPRLQALIHIKDTLDNDFSLFSYMPRMYSFYTNIKADYLISSHVNINSFVFIIQSTGSDTSICDFLCCSSFEKGNRDYEQNQRQRTLLKKERIHLASDTTDILFDKLTKSTSEKTTASSDDVSND